MFKKRIRVAGAFFCGILLLTLVCVIGWLISGKYSRGTGELKVLTGDPDVVEGVKINLGVAERMWDGNEVYADRETAIRHANHFYKTWTVQIVNGQGKTGLENEREKDAEFKKRMLFSNALRWYLTDGYSYQAEETYLFPEYAAFEEESLRGKDPEAEHYVGRFLCELNGKIYGYPVAEPETGFDVLEVPMTVKRGIYRFDENGTAECVVSMGEYEDDFSFLWLIGEEEKNALTVIGAKENTLLAYTYSLDSDRVEETVLWKNGKELSEWTETAKQCIMADFVTVGERMYLCYTDIDFNRVRLVVFEGGQRIFEGELWEREHGAEDLRDFSLSSNQTTGYLSVLDKLEISVVK